MDRVTLDDILNNDPFNLLPDIKAKNPVITADDRLVASFEEINSFYEKNDCEPQKSTDMNERGLFSRLDGIRKSSIKSKSLKKHDRFNLLKEEYMANINSLDDILDSDPFGLLNTNKEVDIYTLVNVPKIDKDRADADFVARREKFEEFEKYEPLLIQCQQDLREGKRKLVLSVESRLSIGTFCVLDGVLLYIADIEKGYQGNSGRINRRTTLVFENGTKSNMLLRSLGKRLRDSGNMVTELDTDRADNLFNVGKDDTKNGFIYILKSLSNDDRIATKRDLYKIGFSATSVEARVKNASQDPTYLMADVSVVASFEVYNVSPHKLEQLIHKFFSDSCLDIDIVDEKGDIHRPREWFVAPIDVIEEAIVLISNSKIIDYRYDSYSESIVLR